MGISLSKVGCGDISIHHHSKKNYNKSSFRRQHTVKIDKTKIGIPTDFRHTYHVGNGSPVMDEFSTDNSSIHNAASIVSESDFMATMAQITDALQKLPLHTYTSSPRVTPLKQMGNSISDEHIIPRRSISVLSYQHKELPSIEVSTSMVIRPFKALEEYSGKERNVLQMTKAVSVQHMDSLSSLNMTTSDLTGGYYDFSSCLQSRIDAQIVELARTRSKNNNNKSSSSDAARSPRNNLRLDKPTIMI